MMKRHRTRDGDIICIPLADSLVAVGLVLHVSKLFQNAVMIGFYDRPFESCESIDLNGLGGPFIDAPNYTWKRNITLGEWPVVGKSVELLAKATIPHLAVSYSLYYKDEFVRLLAP